MLGLISLLSTASFAQDTTNPAPTDTTSSPAQTDTTARPAQVDTATTPAQVDTATQATQPAQTDTATTPAQMDTAQNAVPGNSTTPSGSTTPMGNANAGTYTITGGDAGYDWRDSTKIPTRRLPQLTEFVNNQYPYPPKPRSMWELGFSAGNSMIFGDIKSKADLGGGITLRKAISHIFSYRLGYFGSYNQGYPSGYQAQTDKVAYQNWTHSGALDFIVSLNPNSHYRGNPKTNVYVFGGYSLSGRKSIYKKRHYIYSN
ncbi:MAG: hypothetical protein WKG06_37385 [Segetibacter sp.]